MDVIEVILVIGALVLLTFVSLESDDAEAYRVKMKRPQD
jgi:hypothetical protein